MTNSEKFKQVIAALNGYVRHLAQQTANDEPVVGVRAASYLAVTPPTQLLFARIEAQRGSFTREGKQ